MLVGAILMLILYCKGDQCVVKSDESFCQVVRSAFVIPGEQVGMSDLSEDHQSEMLA